MKVRTRSFLTKVDTIKDNCFQEKEACASKFREFIKGVPFSQLIEDENSSVFQEVLRSEVPNKTGYEKADKVLAELDQMCKNVKDEDHAEMSTMI